MTLNINPGKPTQETDLIKSLVPSKTAYLTAWISLVISGVAGGFIGYALTLVFVPQFKGPSLFISSLIISISIVLSMNILVSLALQASVEWKARQRTTKSSDRPSKIIKNQC